MTLGSKRDAAARKATKVVAAVTSSRSAAGPREWAGLAVLALPTALLGLDVTLLYLALPALAVDLQPSSVEALWIMDAYGFMIAGFLVTMGTLGDRIGRRRLLMIGSAAFAIASVLAAYSWTAEMLIVARAALGVAGATLMPSTLALLSNMFPDPRDRALAIGCWATMFALGMAAGPLVGGLLLEQYWWGSAFLVSVPVVGIVLSAGPFLLPEHRVGARERIDLVSVALSLAAILPVIYFLKESAKSGISLLTVTILAAGIICGVAFVNRQQRLSAPLLDIGLFANRTFSTALAILLVGLIGVGGAMLLVTQYLQLVLKLPPVTAGLWMGPPALAMLLAGIGSPILARRIPPGSVVAGALAFASLGYAFLAATPWVPGVTPVVIGYSLVYLGLGTIAALGTDLVIGAAPPEKAGSASAISETVQELGIAVGVAVIGSITTAVYRSQISAHNPETLPENVSRALHDSLWTASSVATRPPAGLLERAEMAFVAGMGASSVVVGVATIVLAWLSARGLRRVGPIAATAEIEGQ